MGVDYLEESLSYYTKILIEDNNKVEADTKKLESISNFKKKKKNKKKIYRKIREIFGLLIILSSLIRLSIVAFGFF